MNKKTITRKAEKFYNSNFYRGFLLVTAIIAHIIWIRTSYISDNHLTMPVVSLTIHLIGIFFVDMTYDNRKDNLENENEQYR